MRLNVPAELKFPLESASLSVNTAIDAVKSPIPDYLREHYWWAYIHPRAVKLFERDWLINAILWGNYDRLSQIAIDSITPAQGQSVLQIACAYGRLTLDLAHKLAQADATLDVIDVLPIQLINLRKKLAGIAPANLHCMDSTALDFHDASYDDALLFFLMHEQPAATRRRSLEEAFRILKPGGKLVIIDYARPKIWHPLRWLMPLVLRNLEPFALDLWTDDLSTWIPPKILPHITQHDHYFGGLYQKLVVVK